MDKREGVGGTRLPEADFQAVMVVQRVAPDPHGASDRRIVRLEAMSILGCPQRAELVVEGPAAVPWVDALEAGVAVDVNVRLAVIPGGMSEAKDRAMHEAIGRRMAEHKAVRTGDTAEALASARLGEEAALELHRMLAQLKSLAGARGGDEFRVDAEALEQAVRAAGEFHQGMRHLVKLLEGAGVP